MVEKAVSVKVGQLWSQGGEKRAQGCSDGEGPGWTLPGQTPLSWFCACAHVCLASLPGHMKDFLEENGLSTFQSTSAEPTGEGRSSGKAVMDGQAISSPQCLWQHPADGQAGQTWRGEGAGAQCRRGVLRQLPLQQTPSRPQNVQYCFAPSTHSSCGCRFTFR